MKDGDEIIKQSALWAAIVPQLVVADMEASLDFYTRLVGLELGHVDAERRVLQVGGDQLVLVQAPPLDDPVAVSERPGAGAGVQPTWTLRIALADPNPAYERLRTEKATILVPMEVYELVDGEGRWTRMRFRVADPDGFVLEITDGGEDTTRKGEVSA